MVVDVIVRQGRSIEAADETENLGEGLPTGNQNEPGAAVEPSTTLTSRDRRTVVRLRVRQRRHTDGGCCYPSSQAMFVKASVRRLGVPSASCNNSPTKP